MEGGRPPRRACDGGCNKTLGASAARVEAGRFRGWRAGGVGLGRLRRERRRSPRARGDRHRPAEAGLVRDRRRGRLGGRAPVRGRDRRPSGTVRGRAAGPRDAAGGLPGPRRRTRRRALGRRRRRGDADAAARPRRRARLRRGARPAAATAHLRRRRSGRGAVPRREGPRLAHGRRRRTLPVRDGRTNTQRGRAPGRLAGGGAAAVRARRPHGRRRADPRGPLGRVGAGGCARERRFLHRGARLAPHPGAAAGAAARDRHFGGAARAALRACGPRPGGRDAGRDRGLDPRRDSRGARGPRGWTPASVWPADSRISAPSSNTCRLLARDHAAPESTLALTKAASLGRERVQPLAWCSRPRSSAALLDGALAVPLRELLDEHRGEDLDLYARTINPQFVRLLQTIGFDRRWARGEGAYLYDADGTRYLDLLGGFGRYNVGRNNPRIRAGLGEALELETPGKVQLGVSPLPGLLAEELLKRTPDRLARVLFTSSGTDAVEAALQPRR